MTTSSPRCPSSTGSDVSGIEHLADEFRFVQVKESRVFPALETQRARFGQAMMVDDAGSPGLFDAFTRCGNAASRFSGHNEHTNTQFLKAGRGAVSSFAAISASQSA